MLVLPVGTVKRYRIIDIIVIRIHGNFNWRFTRNGSNLLCYIVLHPE